MGFFARCSGKCCVCGCGGFCLAGDGDDDFFPATKEHIIENLDEGRYSDDREYMKKWLLDNYGFVYEEGVKYHYQRQGTCLDFTPPTTKQSYERVCKRLENPEGLDNADMVILGIYKDVLKKSLKKEKKYGKGKISR